MDRQKSEATRLAAAGTAASGGTRVDVPSAAKLTENDMLDPRGSVLLPLDAACQIDAICERFEQALQAGRPLTIENCLADSASDGLEPCTLLRELLALDVEYRLRRGERPTPDDYLARFHPNEPIVELVFQESAKSQSEAVPPFLVDHPRYRVQRLLGSGGMGSVYLAEHRVLERAVALKVINPELLSDPGMVERFRSEAKAAARLSHPNVVTVYDAETAGQGHFLVMEYVPGTDLARTVVERGPLPVSAACDYIAQAALGLQHAHQHGMVHRDITPRNLMLTGDGRVKVLDFGLAYFVSEAVTGRGRPGTGPSFGERSHPANQTLAENMDLSPSLTAANLLLGSIDYMAPEQAADPHSADIRADVYSLGCTLYFLLTGQPPFAHGTLSEKIESHANRLPPAVGDVRDDVPPQLVEVLDRMLAKSPADRYQTPQEVAAALAPFAGNKGTTFLPISRKHWWRGRRRWIVAAVGVLLCGLVLADWKAGWKPFGDPADEAGEASVEAKRLYREGVLMMGQRQEARMKLAIERLRNAVELAPDYARAYAALADAYNLSGDYGWEKPDDVFPKAEEAARKALSLDDKLAEAHLALAFVLNTYDGKNPQAEKEFRLALKLDPTLSAAYHWYAWFLVQQGRPDEAAKQMAQAEKLGSDQLIIANNAGKIAYLRRDYLLAIKKHQHALELSPDFRKAHRDLAMVYAETGKLDEALHELDEANGMTDDGRDVNSARAYAYARNGHPRQARELLAQLEPLAKDKPLAYSIAAVYSALGDKDRAFDWLGRAFREHSAGRSGIAVDPRFDGLHSDRRFKALIKP
jgi:serine/threonine protein kinase/Flp pilus assembly protein TadD